MHTFWDVNYIIYNFNDYRFTSQTQQLWQSSHFRFQTDCNDKHLADNVVAICLG